MRAGTGFHGRPSCSLTSSRVVYLVRVQLRVGFEIRVRLRLRLRLRFRLRLRLRSGSGSGSGSGLGSRDVYDVSVELVSSVRTLESVMKPPG